MSRRLTVVGDAVLDRDLQGDVSRLSPEAPVPVVDERESRPRPGGAGLAATLAALDGRGVTLVTAIGNDRAGEELRSLLDQAGVELIDLGLNGSTPEKVRIRADGHTLLRLDRCGGGEPGILGVDARRALASGSALLVADYGRGVASSPDVFSALVELAGRQPLIWDPHPRGGTPPPGARLVTPNRAEAGVQGGFEGAARRAAELRREWRAAAVAITLGGEGAVLAEGDGPPTVVPARRLPALDVCGAGDRFASAAAGLLADGAPAAEAVSGAVAAASAFVAAGGAAALGRERAAGAGAQGVGMEAASAAVSGVRTRGGRVVATGGCFDLLHAGHVRSLQDARALGDCLIVCLNSDASVRRLKGPGRPVVSEADRAAVLSALGCVDAVVVFDEDTPEALLGRLRPDVFAKGGDYAVADLPEARLLSSWGGEVVLLPYIEGKSTSRLLDEVRSGG